MKARKGKERKKRKGRKRTKAREREREERLKGRQGQTVEITPARVGASQGVHLHHTIRATRSTSVPRGN